MFVLLTQELRQQDSIKCYLSKRNGNGTHKHKQTHKQHINKHINKLLLMTDNAKLLDRTFFSITFNNPKIPDLCQVFAITLTNDRLDFVKKILKR